MSETVIQRWHKYVENQDPSILSELIAEDAVFHSPVVHTPQAGKKLCMMYLIGAMQVFSQGSFRYVGQWDQSNGAVLEFESKIDGITVNGVDLIHWNDEGQIVEFKVMVRPLKGMQKIHEKMQAMLESMK
jgi:hypothetical protein